MKKIVSAVVLLLVVVSMIAIAFSAHPAKANGLVGDLNDDGKVNGLDVVIIAKAYNSQTGDPRYISEGDFNMDGKIDGVDIAVLAAHFGERT